MAARQVHDDQVVKLFDLESGMVILNPTKEKAREGIVNEDHIYVCKPAPELGEISVALDRDERPEGRGAAKVAKAFTQYACLIQAKLLQKQNECSLPGNAEKISRELVVYCKNSRTRSPSVLLVFFMIFRGYSLDACKLWFQGTYPIQRPATVAVSAMFPNFARFENVLQLIQSALNDKGKVITYPCLIRD